MKIKMTVELDCESWMDDDIEPKNKAEWTEFFMKYLIEYPKSIIGSETEKGQEIITLDSFSIEVTDVSLAANGMQIHAVSVGLREGK